MTSATTALFFYCSFYEKKIRTFQEYFQNLILFLRANQKNAAVENECTMFLEASKKKFFKKSSLFINALNLVSARNNWRISGTVDAQ